MILAYLDILFCLVAIYMLIKESRQAKVRWFTIVMISAFLIIFCVRGFVRIQERRAEDREKIIYYQNGVIKGIEMRRDSMQHHWDSLVNRINILEKTRQ